MNIGPIDAQQQLGAQQRRVYHEQKAEAAAGVGQPDGEDHEVTERNADGRHPSEARPEHKENAASPDAPPSRDPSRQSGNLLDLTG